MFRLLGITLFLLIILNNSSYSQNFAIEKKNTFLTGSISFSSTSGELYTADDNSKTNLKYNVEFGAFIENGLILAGSFSLNRISSCGESNTQVAIGPRIFYFFGDRTHDTYPFIDGGASLIFHRASKVFSEIGNGTSFHVGAGLCHLVTNNLGLFCELSYEDDEISSTETGKKINITVGISKFIF